jgi:heptosyltransferase-3
MLKEYRNIKKIIVSRTDKLGDAILTLPLISKLKEIFPDSKIDFLISKTNSELFKDYPGINSLVLYDEFKSFSQKLSFLKKEKYDLAVTVYPRLEIALLFYLARIKVRIGTGYRGYSFFFNKRVYEHRKTGDKHESDYNLNLLNPIIGDFSFEKKYYFSYNAGEFKLLSEKLSKYQLDLLSKYIIIHPGSKKSAKDWSVGNFSDLLKILLFVFPDYKIILTGIEEESDVTSELNIKSGDNNRTINLAGKLSLRELLILIDKSKLFISNSTGPIHIAGALNKYIIGFYPDEIPMNETRWRPLSEYAVILKPETLNGDMDSISPLKVLEEVKKILKNSRSN